jgi:anti-anti-sigma factor
MTQPQDRVTANRITGIEILGTPAELDLATAGGLVEQGCAVIARRPALLLLDLTGLSFCDARGLGAFVQIANRADAAGCRFALIAPRPQVAKVLRVGGLNSRIPVFATIGGAVAQLPVPVLACSYVSASPS